MSQCKTGTYELCQQMLKRKQGGRPSGPNELGGREHNKVHRAPANYECTGCANQYFTYKRFKACMITCSALAKSATAKKELVDQLGAEEVAEARRRKQQLALIEAEKIQMVQAKKAFSEFLFSLLHASQEVDARVVVSSSAHIAERNGLTRLHRSAILRADKQLQWLLVSTDLTPSRPRDCYRCSLCGNGFPYAQGAVDCFMAHVPNLANNGPSRLVRLKKLNAELDEARIKYLRAHNTPSFDPGALEIPPPKRPRWALR